jgi:hypothetical protein
MKREHGSESPKVFNYAIWLYDMNADDVFDHHRHLIVDSSLGVIEEAGDVPADSLDAPSGH